MDLDFDAIAGRLDPPRQPGANPPALGPGEASGTPVRQQTFPVDRGEVPPRHDRVGRDVETEAQRLEHPPADVHIRRSRLVAEQGEVARSAARRDAGTGRNQPAQRRPGRQPVEVGRPRFVQGGPRLSVRSQVADAVEHKQHDPALVRLRQPAQKCHPPPHGSPGHATKYAEARTCSRARGWKPPPCSRKAESPDSTGRTIQPSKLSPRL